MVETARQNLVFENDRRGLHAVPAAEFPDDTAVVLVQAIDIAIRRRKIDAVAAQRRLARPGGAAPGILVQAAAHEFGFHLPDDFQLAVFPRAGTIKVSLAI